MQRNYSVSLSGATWSPLYFSLHIPSSSLQTIFFCFFIGIHKTENNSIQALPILSAQAPHLISLCLPVYHLSGETWGLLASQMQFPLPKGPSCMGDRMGDKAMWFRQPKWV